MKINKKHIDPEFVDERGFISRIIDQDKYSVHSVLFIERKKGSRGADHYHKEDSHFVYIISGKVRRSEKDMKTMSGIVSTVLIPGDIVFTPSMIAHSDEFLEDTTMLAVTTSKRNQKDYEKDTVRVDFFKPQK